MYDTSIVVSKETTNTHRVYVFIEMTAGELCVAWDEVE